MLGSPAGPGGPTQRGLWPLAPAPIPSATNFAADGYNKYGLYSFLPGSPTFGSALYSHSSAIGRFATGSIQPTPGTAFHAAAHKVSDSFFASTGFTFGAPTPPPGSPYSPVPVTQLEVLAKGFNSNIIIQQPDYQQQAAAAASKKLLEAATKHASIDDHHVANCGKKSCCSCAASPTKASKFLGVPSGCSRTNPVDWNLVSIKKEPGATPCQVAEVTTSDSPTIGATIKVEAASPTQKTTCMSNVCHQQASQLQAPPQMHTGSINALPSVVTSNGNIPVGIAVARQRIHQHQEIVTSPSLPPIAAGPAGLLTTVSATQIKDVARISELDAGMAASSGAAGVAGGGTLLQCPPDDRGGGFASWPVGGAHNSALATPTLWQYPAHLPMEPLVPMPVPMPPVGFQLVRDHNTGGLLLLPTTGVEQVQQVVWPSYHQPSSHVLLPPSLPPPPLQLLGSSSDYLQTSTTLHQHTQTHSTRLLAVTTDKRKLPLPIPTTTLIKIESELDQSKALQAVSSFDNNTGTVFTDPNMGPLVTTHVIYQHPTNLILSSQTPAPADTGALPTAATCRSQATSPVACLTPPPENLSEEETSVQDASNQTDASECDAAPEPQQSKDEVQNTLPPCANAGGGGESSICVPETCVQPLHAVPNCNKLVTSEIAGLQLEPPPQQQLPPQTSRHEERAPQLGAAVHNDLPPPADGECHKGPETVEQCPAVHEGAMESDVGNGVNDQLNALSPDISGLELLSNSIVEFERTHNKSASSHVADEVPAPSVKTNDEVLEGIAQMTLADKPMPPIIKEELGGLDLLCALAEQRFMEEVTSDANAKGKRAETDPSLRANKPEKRKSESDLSAEYETSQKQFKTGDIQSDVKKRDNSIRPCTCREDSYRTYKTKESEEEAKRFLASKSQPICCNSDWPCMNAMELDMRMRLADLQRKYREKQKELHKLKPKKHERYEHHREKKAQRARKKSVASDRSTPPPLLDKMDTVPFKHSSGSNKGADLLKPPTLCAYGSSQDNQNANPIRHERPDASPLSPYLDKSSKKRKVGRPKKLMSTSGLQSGTETIVAKKPKKGNLVGYLLAAKEKLIQNNAVLSDPPRYLEDVDCRRKKKRSKIRPRLKAVPTLKAVVVHRQDDAESDDVDDADSLHSHQEVNPFEEFPHGDSDEDTAKHCADESADELEESPRRKQLTELSEDAYRTKTNGECVNTRTDDICHEERDVEDEQQQLNEDCCSTKGSVHEASEGCASPARPADDDIEHEEEEEEEEQERADDEDEEEANPESAKPDCRCTLTTEHLEQDKLRVLTAMGGLFYAGRLHAVEPPDVYSITLDGERGNRPHIMSREEILRDAIVEVSPANTDELPPGTRLCAYWSQQYRCLYPGSVAEPESPNPALDSKFVSVEFDDGDSGRIAIEDIRLLPVDYPIIEYDPNPLLSLCKKRRRASTIDERRSTVSNKSPPPSAPPPPLPTVIQPSKADEVEKSEKENLDVNKQLDAHKERKRLKKKKRDKLKQRLRDEKKKKKKHKCVDENCKHRKHHKKHRKHKKHHHSKDAHEASSGKRRKQGHAERVAAADEDGDDDDERAEEPDGNGDDDVDDVDAARACSPEPEEPEVQYPEYHIVANPEDEVTMDDILESSAQKNKKFRDRQESCESRSKMSAFLPARQLWGWSGKGYKRPKTKGRSRKQFYRAIQRGKETIQVGDSAVFLSTGRPDRPYIGKIEAMWESCGTMVVKVKWFYHPEETIGCPLSLKYPGALFESPHVDENDVQTISHKCEVLPLKDYTDKLGDDPQRYATIYDNNDIYYLAGYYDPTTVALKMEPEIPFNKTEAD